MEIRKSAVQKTCSGFWIWTSTGRHPYRSATEEELPAECSKRWLVTFFLPARIQDIGPSFMHRVLDIDGHHDGNRTALLWRRERR